MKNPRTIERILNAAAAVEVETHREAAILGGIVRSLVDTGHLRPKFIHHYTPQAIAWFARDLAAAGVLVDGRYPTDGEVRRMASKFLEKYDPGAASRVAA